MTISFKTSRFAGAASPSDSVSSEGQNCSSAHATHSGQASVDEDDEDVAVVLGVVLGGRVGGGGLGSGPE